MWNSTCFGMRKHGEEFGSSRRTLLRSSLPLWMGWISCREALKHWVEPWEIPVKLALAHKPQSATPLPAARVRDEQRTNRNRGIGCIALYPHTPFPRTPQGRKFEQECRKVFDREREG